MGVGTAQSRIVIFLIRQINIDQSFQDTERFRLFVGGSIVNNRDGKSLFFCRIQCGYDLGNKVGWCDEIDVVRALFLQFQKNLG